MYDRSRSGILTAALRGLVNPLSLRLRYFESETRFAISSRPVILPALSDNLLLARWAGCEIETPSWGYGNSGTRFKVFPWPGAARDLHEKLADAAMVHRLTGCCPTRRAAHPVGQRRRLGRAAPLRRGAGRAHRRDQPEPLPGRRLPLGSSATPTRGCAARPSTTACECIEIAGERRLDAHQPLVGRRHQLPGPGRSPRAQASAAGVARGDLRRAARRACGC